MSLRIRLIVLVVAAFAVSLAIGGAIMLVIASRSVQTEMRSALRVGQQSVLNAVREIDRSSDPERGLADLIASFKGHRHLWVGVIGAAPAEAIPAGERRPFGKAPAWFARLVGVESEAEQVLVTSGGKPFATIRIATVPRNEIHEVWNDLTWNLLVIGLIGGQTIALIYLFVGRALRPLDRLAGAMELVGEGNYQVRVSDSLTPELARLRDSFNRMAGRLAAIDAANRRLNDQLLTLQEEERGDIARDLHDEIGPSLFAINIDITRITHLLEEQRIADLSLHVRAIADAAQHLQRQVRGMLGRLRTNELAELGLGAAISGLVEFWRRRYPNIQFRIDVSLACEQLGSPTDMTAYRIVQEGLSNAVRHGSPGWIAITITGGEAVSDGVTVEVADDGRGMPELPTLGYGLTGMAERVRAVGGDVSFSGRPDGGFIVRAKLPGPWSPPRTSPELLEIAR